MGKNRSHVRITGVTVGKIVDYGLKDSQNMGACMAPAACDTIIQNLEDFERKETDYDRIITGDLGYVGQSILFDLMRGKEHDIKINHMDCGMQIFDEESQDTHAGGSGKQSGHAGHQRDKAHRAAAESRHSEISGKPKGKAAAKSPRRAGKAHRQADGEAAHRAESGRIQYRDHRQQYQIL